MDLEKALRYLNFLCVVADPTVENQDDGEKAFAVVRKELQRLLGMEETVSHLIAYWDRNTSDFQHERASDFVNELRMALET